MVESFIYMTMSCFLSAHAYKLCQFVRSPFRCDQVELEGQLKEKDQTKQAERRGWDGTEMHLCPRS